jgi:hypothetical protein
MTAWTIAIAALTLMVVGTGTFFAVRNQVRLRLGYGFTKPVLTRISPGEVGYVFEIVLRNLSRRAIKADEFIGQIEAYLGVRVVGVNGLTSRPKERVLPEVPNVAGMKLLIDSFAFCLRQEVRIRVVTAESPHDMHVQADAPDVILRRLRRLCPPRRAKKW